MLSHDAGADAPRGALRRRLGRRGGLRCGALRARNGRGRGRSGGRWAPRPSWFFPPRPPATLREVIAQMKATEISQVPIVEGGKLRGIVAEVDLLRALVSGGKTFESPIAEVIEDDYATVTPNTKIELLKTVLADAKVAIVEDAGEVLGIVTKIDLIDFLARSAQKPAAPPAA